MREEMVRPFLKLPFPVVILDAYFENLNCNYVVPNNRQGAYLATDYLISRRMDTCSLLTLSATFQSVWRDFIMLSMITECPVPAVLSTSFLQPLMEQWQICLQLLTGEILWQTVILRTMT